MKVALGIGIGLVIATGWIGWQFWKDYTRHF